MQQSDSAAPSGFLDQFFLLNYLVSQIFTENLQYVQDLVLGMENKGDEKCCVVLPLVSKVKCILTSILLSRFSGDICFAQMIKR